jgi:hypothetical protein
MGVNYHALGGGLFQLSVTSYFERTTSGAAEWFCYEFLRDLGKTGIGKLQIADQVWIDTLFTGGKCSIRNAANSSYICYELTFIRSLPKDAGLAAKLTPDPVEPAEAGARTSAGSYTFATKALGTHAFIDSMSVSRPSIVETVPRGLGVRVKSRRGARRLSLNVSSWYRVVPDGVTYSRPPLEKLLHDSFHELSSQKGDLVGQGNTFQNCYLTDFSPDSGDNLWTAPVSLSFEHELEPTV